MLRSMFRSRLLGFGLAGVLGVAVIGGASVAFADDPPGGATPAAPNQPGDHGHPHGVHIIKITLADIVKHSGLSADVFKQGFKDGKSINEVLQANGVDPAKVQAAVLADLKSKLDEAVASKKLTQEQADKLYGKAQTALTNLMSHVPKQGDPGKGNGGDHPGKPGPHAGKGMIGSAADAIGVDAKTLLEAMKDGKSIADVAKEHNVDPKAVIDAVVSDLSAQIDEAVASGKIKPEMAEKMKAHLNGLVTSFVNSAHQGHPGHKGHGAPPSQAN